MSNRKKEPFEYTIQPGYQVRNVKVLHNEEIDADASILSNYQTALFTRLSEEYAEQIRAEMNVQIEQEKRTAYQNGIQVGIKQTEAKYQKDLQQIVNLFEMIGTSYEQDYQLFVEQQEQTLLDIILKIARKVVNVELQLNPEIINVVLRNSLMLLNEKQSVRVFVNPEDWMRVKDAIEALRLKMDLPENVEVMIANDISQGGCRIDFKSGSIDAEIDTQFDEIRRKILKDAATV